MSEIRNAEVNRLAAMAMQTINDNINGASGTEILTAIMSMAYSTILFIEEKQDREIFRGAIEKMYALLPERPNQEVN